MFLLNETVVYPGYGAAVIRKLVKKLISGKPPSFYALKFFNKDMAVLVPEDRLESVGIRRLSSDQELESMFHVLSEPVQRNEQNEVGLNNWNRRNKKYQLNLRSGDLIKIGQIYKDLEYIAQNKELSFGERTLKTKIEQLLIEEISVVKNIDQEKAYKFLQGQFVAAKKLGSPSSLSKKKKTVNPVGFVVEIE